MAYAGVYRRALRPVGGDVSVVSGAGYATHSFAAVRSGRSYRSPINDGEWWSPRSEADAIADIETGTPTRTMCRGRRSGLKSEW
jgi:hypothetical protein